MFSIYTGLATLPCHGLVDTGAQDGVIGLWHFQRWIICLALCYELQPVFLPLPDKVDCGGIEGNATVLAIVDVPTGFAGVNGLTR